MTWDGQLVCRHECEVSDWFVEDFTLAEVKTLWASERMGHLRGSNTVCDERLRVATFEELQQVRTRASRELGREVGVSVELKHPSRYRELGMDMHAQRSRR